MASNNNHSQEIIDICLERLRTGRESVDAIISDYPDQSETLRPILETALWLYSNNHVFDPHPLFVEESVLSIVSNLKAEEPKIKSPVIKLPSISLRPIFTKRALQFISIIFLLVVFVFSNIFSGVVFAGVIPGDLLYPVKIGYEDIQSGLTFNDVSDFNLYARFSQRRVNEIYSLVGIKRFNPIPLTVNRYIYQVGSAIEEINSIYEYDPVTANYLASGFSDFLVIQATNLENLLQLVPHYATDKISDAVWYSNNTIALLGEITGKETAEITKTPASTSVISIEKTTEIPSGTVETTPVVSSTPIPSESPVTSVPTTETVPGTISPTSTTRPESTPIPTKTTKPTQTEVTPHPTQVPTNTPKSTGTPTLTPSTTPGPTNTPSPTPTRTPSPTPRPTHTPSPTPTWTPRPTNTPSSTPTWTPSPTPRPTHTPTPTYTWTPSPTPRPTQTPSPTPTPEESCQVFVKSLSIKGNKFTIKLDNKGSTPVIINEMYILWPYPNKALKEIVLDSTSIWQGYDTTSPSIIGIDDWTKEASDRKINPSSISDLDIMFNNKPVIIGYRIRITFHYGCILNIKR